MPAFQRILVAVDGSDTSNKALATAIRMARDGGAATTLHVVHVIDSLLYMTGYECSAEIAGILEREGRRLLDESKKVAADAGVQADATLIDRPGSRLGDLIAREAERVQADLVVVGTHGRRGVGRMLLGSGAEQILRLAPVPVLAVRG